VHKPFFFAENTITSAIYLDKPENWLWPQMTEDIPQDLIQFQDGVPLHYHWKLQQFLDDNLPGYWVGHAGSIPWPARSPNLNPLDFLFWGYVNEHVYILPLPKTVTKLQECISETMASLNANMLCGTWQQFEHRLHVCCVTRGAHIGKLQLLICNLQHLE
jgi:hypothetical protein